MTTLKTLFVIATVTALASDGLLLPKLSTVAGAAVPILIGGKLFFVPKVVALKAGIGMLGLKYAGAKYLKSKVLIPASLAGAKAGYKATSSVLNAPRIFAEGKARAIKKLIPRAPSMAPVYAQPATYSDFQTSFKVPAVPIPAVQWYQQPVTLNLPKVVLQQPPTSTITLTKTPYKYPVSA